VSDSFVKVAHRSIRLKPIDIGFMRRLHLKVNLIPVIAKADTLTDDEVVLFKQRASSRLSYFAHHTSQILADIAHHGIRIFQTPQYEDEDEETVQENEEITVRYTFQSPLR